MTMSGIDGVPFGPLVLQLFSGGAIEAPFDS
jgi:hypothetical protein